MIINNCGQRYLELYENDQIILIKSIPDFYSYKFHLDQINGLVIDAEESIKEIEKAAELSNMATSSYYGSMEPGIGLTEDELIKIYSDERVSLKKLLTCLNKVKEKIK